MDASSSQVSVVSLSAARLAHGTLVPRGRAPAPDVAVYLLEREPDIADWSHPLLLGTQA